MRSLYYSKTSDGSVRISTRVFGSGDGSTEELLKYHPTIAKQRNVKLAFFLTNIVLNFRLCIRSLTKTGVSR